MFTGISDPNISAAGAVVEETSHLAPCGVPMNPMARNLSSSKLHEAGGQPGKLSSNY